MIHLNLYFSFALKQQQQQPNTKTIWKNIFMFPLQKQEENFFITRRH